MGSITFFANLLAHYILLYNGKKIELITYVAKVDSYFIGKLAACILWQYLKKPSGYPNCII